MSKYDVRCFRRKEKGKDDRRGLWIMTRPAEPERCRGAFFHGDHRTVEPPAYSIVDLEKMDAAEAGIYNLIGVEEIDPEEAVRELANWPEAEAKARRILERHRK